MYSATCKLCGKTGQLIRAHVIPRSFFKQLDDGSGPLRVASGKAGSYPRKSPTGVYDCKLVCQRCETLFSPWDGYAQALLLAPYQEDSYIKSNGQKVAYLFPTVDYHKLKLFFVSVLWRACASQEGFFAKIKLGPFEATAKRLILTNDPGEMETFTVALARFEDKLGRVMLDPDRTKFLAVNYYRFYLAGYIAYIKVDRQKTPEFLSDVSLAPERPLAIILRDFKSSKELTALKNLAKAISRLGNTN